MLAKLGLYANTVKSMKPSQVYYRIRKMLKLDCSIGCKVTSDVSKAVTIATVDELDYDPVFLRRFPADELLDDLLVNVFCNGVPGVIPLGHDVGNCTRQRSFIGMKNGILMISPRCGILTFITLSSSFRWLMPIEKQVTRST